MRSLPNLIGHMSGPRLRPKSFGNNYIFVDPFYDPDFWTGGYVTNRIIGISSSTTIRFNYTTTWNAKSSKGYYKVTNTEETYLPYTDPYSNGFDQIADKNPIIISNGQYLSVSLDSGVIGSDADYAEAILEVKDDKGIFSYTLGTYGLEIYAP